MIRKNVVPININVMIIVLKSIISLLGDEEDKAYNFSAEKILK